MQVECRECGGSGDHLGLDGVFRGRSFRCFLLCKVGLTAEKRFRCGLYDQNYPRPPHELTHAHAKPLYGSPSGPPKEVVRLTSVVGEKDPPGEGGRRALVYRRTCSENCGGLSASTNIRTRMHARAPWVPPDFGLCGFGTPVVLQLLAPPFSWSLVSNGFGTSYMALNCERGRRDTCQPVPRPRSSCPRGSGVFLHDRRCVLGCASRGDES